MITLYDYLPSQNAWKLRQLLELLGQPYAQQFVSIFEGEGQTCDYLQVNPWGAVPAISLPDGRTLSESNAILRYLADGSPYLPGDRYGSAKVAQWLSFEIDYIQNSVGSLRYWTLTGKIGARPADMVAGKTAGAERALAALDRELSQKPFLLGEQVTIADIAIYAYAHLAGDGGVDLSPYPHFNDWAVRFGPACGYLAEVHPYSIDPHCGSEL